MARPYTGYKAADGKRVPGVTTIVGRFKDSSALLWWAFDQGKAAERGEIRSLYDKRDEAADSGTLAHDAIEAYLKGGDPEKVLSDADDKIRIPAEQGFRNAVEWLEQTKIEVLDTEFPLVSEEYRFGGTPDAIGKDTHGRIVLLDWKTSKGVYLDMLIQLAAYGHLLKECRDITVERYHLCRFDKANGDFAHHMYTDLSDAWEQFLLFRAAYDIDKRLKKRV